MAAPKTIYLIDGSAFLYRAFHAIRSLATSKGHPTNATFGFTRILLKLLKDKDPKYAGVFFDVKGPTFRHKMFDEYKANRPPMPEELAVQIPDIKEVVKALNIPIIEKEGYEADDLVGTYARIAQEQGFKVVMVTGDKDFIQLITDECTLWDPMKDTVTDRSGVKADMGIEPEQFIDVLGLAGDTADNIPGVKGVGVKTAVKLIVEYGSISGIYENLDQLKKKKKLHENLTASKEIVDLSRDLAAINRQVDVDHPLDDFQLQEFDTRKAFELFQSFEFKALATEFSQTADKSKKNYKIVHTIADMENLASALEKNGEFAIDTETTALDPMRADLVGISVSYEKDTGFYIPVGHTTNTNGIEMPPKDDILCIFKPLLENPDIAKVGQNIKYDFIVLARYGIELKGIVFDTMIASHLLNPGTRGHGLDRIAMNLFGHKMISYEEVTGKGKDQIGFQEVPLDLAADYAAEDADLTFMAYEALKQQIEDNGLTPLMETIEVPLICVLAKMEMAGIRVDTDVLGQMSREFEEELKSLEEKIYELAGEEFNINSSQQLGVILFEKLGLKAVKKTKKKTGYSTDVQVLTQLAETHEMPEKLLRYRTLGKLKSTYVDALSSLVHPDTGRIHTSFNQTITVTGRLSSSNPNLQNIPIRKPEGKKYGRPLSRQTAIP